jgi:glycosyltransferase involved in cell wall biosynthesis
MNQQNIYRATILPVAEETTRPLWSVMIPTYNCANYLRETLSSVLEQDPGADVMQIEVVDDHSTADDPKAVVEELGKGRVEFYRQPQNVKHVNNFNTCLQRARGKLIHLLHGDDHVREGFYEKMQKAFYENPSIGAAFSRHIFMDEHGHWQAISEQLLSESGILPNWLERIVVKQYIQTPSIVVRREVYEKLGGFDRRFLNYYEDWEMWVRITANYPISYEVEPLAVYRIHSASNTGLHIRSGENIRDIRRGLDIVQSYLHEYLPQATAIKLLTQNRENSALFALNNAHQMLKTGDTQGGTTQIRESLKLSHSLKVIKRLIGIIWKR